MLIQIMHSDTRFDYVKDTMLDYLIESNKITSFKRSTGWVTIGVDPIRKQRRNNTATSPYISRGIAARPTSRGAAHP